MCFSKYNWNIHAFQDTDGYLSRDEIEKQMKQILKVGEFGPEVGINVVNDYDCGREVDQERSGVYKEMKLDGHGRG